MRGNALLKKGEHEEALAHYAAGLDEIAIFGQSASVLLSERLKEMVAALRRDLQNNGAQAALQLGDWAEALRYAGAVLADEPKQPKALYRRALAYRGRAAEGDAALALADLASLLEVQPGNAQAARLFTTVGRTVTVSGVSVPVV